MTAIVYTVLCAVIGSIAGGLLGCVPSLHVYNVMGLAMLGVHQLSASGITLPAELLVALSVGAVVGWSMTNSLPSVLLAAPDESALLMVLPGRRYARQGRGLEAVMMTAAGGLGGVVVLVFLVGPLVPLLLPTVRSTFGPHSHWVLWVVIVFLLMSEWPRFGQRGQGGWRKFLRGWASPAAGLLTFLLSGLLGFVLRYRSPISVSVAFQNLMPAFVGLFAVPWLVVNILGSADLPPQREDPEYLPLGTSVLVRGVGAGALGGLFAAFFPGVTGGIGGLLAGHATAQRNDRFFLVSQGASKVIYYVGGLLLFFVPGRSLVRGGSAGMLSGVFIPRTMYDYCMALAAVAFAGATAFLLMAPLAKGMLRMMRHVSYRSVSVFSLALVLLVVLGTTGVTGLLVAAVASGIGLIPVLFHSRRINCMGVILLPMACSMSGQGAIVAGWLGLV